MTLILSILLLSLSSFHFAATNASLEVQILGTASDQGQVLVLVFDSKDGFPQEATKAFRQIVLIPKDRKAEFTLADIPQGKYAIVVLHDADGDGLMTTNLLGLPEEKYGFSNNPKIYFRPPSFEKAAFDLKTASKQVTIHLR
jgi:uncharacterized protein (DUF2141 family)